MSKKVALVFIFNHKFDKNIEVLEKLYGSRFSHIYHLVPFYSGNKPNVIPVYDNSQHFQGYIAQGLTKYFDEQFDHYLFIGDDLILNPNINENNYQQYFGLDENCAFIPEIYNLHNLTNNETLRFLPVVNLKGHTNKWYWCKITEFINEYRHGADGVENQNELPSYSEAAEILKNHGYEIQPCNYFDMYGGIFPLSSATVKFAWHSPSIFKKFKLPYPVVGSYSDIVIVPKISIKKFAHYCGVFATNKLFVEFAIPTSLLLSCNKVVTEPVVGKRGNIYWLYTKPEVEKYEAEMKPYNQNLGELLRQFPENKLYMHPVKLSRWKTDL